MKLKEVKQILKQDHRLVKDVVLWGDVIEDAFYKVYERSLSFDEMCQELHIAPWDQQFLLSNEDETVSQYAERIFL